MQSPRRGVGDVGFGPQPGGGVRLRIRCLLDGKWVETSCCSTVLLNNKGMSFIEVEPMTSYVQYVVGCGGE